MEISVFSKSVHIKIIIIFATLHSIEIINVNTILDSELKHKSTINKRKFGALIVTKMYTVIAVNIRTRGIKSMIGALNSKTIYCMIVNPPQNNIEKIIAKK
ncbi:MAG: hypothetical protein NC489_25415 [Ruminococcus flavefaciens]|nr:hypothetical protein [Ruminococcus flavefaciens]